VDTMTDTSNCGTCGNVCTAPAAACCNAACVNLQGDDSENCGSCGLHCGYGEVCIAGHCGPKAAVTVPLQYVPVFQP
jgi:hypothetical protein